MSERWQYLFDLATYFISDGDEELREFGEELESALLAMKVMAKESKEAAHLFEEWNDS